METRELKDLPEIGVGFHFQCQFFYLTLSLKDFLSSYPEDKPYEESLVTSVILKICSDQVQQTVWTFPEWVIQALSLLEGGGFVQQIVSCLEDSINPDEQPVLYTWARLALSGR